MLVAWHGARRWIDRIFNREIEQVKYDIQSGLYLPNHYKRPSPFDGMHLQWFAESSGLWLADAEENNEDEFTGTSVESGNTFTASSDHVIHGNYSFKTTFGGTNSNAYGYYTFGEGQTDLYVRLYFRIDTLSLADGDKMYLMQICDGSKTGTFVVAVIVYGTGIAGQYGCRAYFRNNTSFYGRYAHPDDNIFQDDTDYYIEVHWKQGNGDGVEEFWIDGESKYSNSSQTNTDYDMDTIDIGNEGGDVPTAGTVYFDDIKADSSPIGAYSDSGSSVVPLISQQLRRRV